MKVYIITKGEYSDYHICAVSTDEERAEKLAKIYTTNWGEARVEVFDTDTSNELLAGRVPYEVVFRCDGSVYRSSCLAEYDLDLAPGIKDLDPKRLFYPSETLSVRLYAPDEEAAVKIAAEKRAEYLARKEAII